MQSDAHVHLLPGLDNGPLKDWEAERMFRAMYQSGVRTALLTPHFDAGAQTVDTFLCRRRLSFACFRETIRDLWRNVRFFLSAEVELNRALVGCMGLQSLCIPKTRMLPVSLPIGSGITPDAMSALAYLVQKADLIPMFCHTERAFLFYTEKEFSRLTSFRNAAFVFSSSAFYTPDVATLAIRLMQEKKRVFLGSNGHGYADRAPVLIPDNLPTPLCRIAVSALAEKTAEAFSSPETHPAFRKDPISFPVFDSDT